MAIQPKPARSDDATQLVNQWLKEKIDAGRKPSVVHSYRSAIEIFRLYLNRHGQDLDTEDLESLQESIDAYRTGGLSRSWKTLAPSSIKWRLDVVHGFYRWAANNGLPTHEMLKFADASEDRDDGVYTNEDYIDNLLGIDTTNLQGKRDFLVLCSVILSKMRLKEVVAMKVGDFLTTPAAAIRVGTQSIAIPAYLANEFESYIQEVYGSEPTEDSPMWVRMNKLTWQEDLEPISRQTIVFAFHKWLGVDLLRSFGSLEEFKKLLLAALEDRQG